MCSVSASIAINPHNPDSIVLRLDVITKSLGYQNDFDIVKNTILNNIHNNTCEKHFTLNDFKLVHLDLSVYSGIEFDLHISSDVKWKEIHNMIIKNIRHYDSDFFNYGTTKKGANLLQDLKLGFNEIHSFSYWNSPWLTFNDNDRVTITHTKRNGVWKKLCTVA